MELEH